MNIYDHCEFGNTKSWSWAWAFVQWTGGRINKIYYRRSFCKRHEHYNYWQLIQSFKIGNYLQKIIKIPGLIKFGLAWREKLTSQLNKIILKDFCRNVRFEISVTFREPTTSGWWCKTPTILLAGLANIVVNQMMSFSILFNFKKFPSFKEVLVPTVQCYEIFYGRSLRIFVLS